MPSRPTPNLLTANIDNRNLGLFQEWILRELTTLEKKVSSVSSSVSAISVNNVNQRQASQTVVAGSNSIVFSAPLTTSTYSLNVYVKVSSVEGFTPTINSRTTTGFVIDCASAGTLYWNAVEAV